MASVTGEIEWVDTGDYSRDVSALAKRKRMRVGNIESAFKLQKAFEIRHNVLTVVQRFFTQFFRKVSSTTTRTTSRLSLDETEFFMNISAFILTEGQRHQFDSDIKQQTVSKAAKLSALHANARETVSGETKMTLDQIIKAFVTTAAAFQCQEFAKLEVLFKVVALLIPPLNRPNCLTALLVFTADATAESGAFCKLVLALVAKYSRVRIDVSTLENYAEARFGVRQQNSIFFEDSLKTAMECSALTCENSHDFERSLLSILRKSNSALCASLELVFSSGGLVVESVADSSTMTVAPVISSFDLTAPAKIVLSLKASKGRHVVEENYFTVRDAVADGGIAALLKLAQMASLRMTVIYTPMAKHALSPKRMEATRRNAALDPTDAINVWPLTKISRLKMDSWMNTAMQTKDALILIDAKSQMCGELKAKVEEITAGMLQFPSACFLHIILKDNSAIDAEPRRCSRLASKSGSVASAQRTANSRKHKRMELETDATETTPALKRRAVGGGVDTGHVSVPGTDSLQPMEDSILMSLAFGSNGEALVHVSDAGESEHSADGSRRMQPKRRGRRGRKRRGENRDAVDGGRNTVQMDGSKAVRSKRKDAAKRRKKQRTSSALPRDPFADDSDDDSHLSALTVETPFTREDIGRLKVKELIPKLRQRGIKYFGKRKAQLAAALLDAVQTERNGACAEKSVDSNSDAEITEASERT